MHYSDLTGFVKVLGYTPYFNIPIPGMDGEMIRIATEIDLLLSEVALLQDDFVARLCGACEESCCRRVTYLFDERDIIFAKVFLRQNVPKRRRRGGRGCSFVSETGCTLLPKARPFTCHRYLCSRLKEDMAAHDPELPKKLNRKFRVLEDLRGRLWRDYLAL